VLGPAIPGHAAAMMVSGDKLIVGTQTTLFEGRRCAGALSVYAGYERDLRPPRMGWFTWERTASLAASTYRDDRLGFVSAVDPYAFHGPSLWIGSRSARARSSAACRPGRLPPRLGA